MKTITFSTGYDVVEDALEGFATKEDFTRHIQKEIIRTGEKMLKGVTLREVFIEDDMWHITVDTTKDALFEFMCRIEEDSSPFSVGVDELRDDVEDIWESA